MLISFVDEATCVEARSLRLLVQKYGDRKGKRVRQRLDELAAAADLETIRLLPALRCQQTNIHHTLMTLCTVHPAAIIFKVEDLTCFDGSVVIWRSVTTVKIISLDENSYD